MSATDRLEILANVKELSTLDGKKLRSLLPFFDEVLIPAGVALAQEGRLGHEFLVIVSGQVEHCRRGQATRVGRSASFGWSEMRDRGRHDATLVTISPARLLVMSHAQFRAAEGLVAAS